MRVYRGMKGGRKEQREGGRAYRSGWQMNTRTVLGPLKMCHKTYAELAAPHWCVVRCALCRASCTHKVPQEVPKLELPHWCLQCKQVNLIVIIHLWDAAISGSIWTEGVECLKRRKQHTVFSCINRYGRSCLMLLHLSSSCLIFPHLASSYLILPHLASFCLIFLHLASSCLIFLHLASSYLFLPHLALSCFILLHLTSSCLI